MTGSINQGGAWKTVNKLAVNVGGTWKTASSAFINVAGTWKQWFAALIADTFTRTTSGSLGNSDTGVPWTAQIGTWYANGSAAQSDDAGSHYSLATVPLGSADATVSASVTPGTGVAVWVQDANNWNAAAAVTTITDNPYTCGCSTCGGGCNGYCTCASSACGAGTVSCTLYYSCQDAACGCNIYNSCASSACGAGSYSCAGTGGTLCYGNSLCCQGQTILGGSTVTYPTCRTSACGCQSYYHCRTAGCGCQTSTTTYPTCQTSACGCCSYNPTYTCGCSTCHSYSTAYYMRLLQAVGGAVSAVTGDISLSAGATAVKVITLGNTATAQAYSDTALTSPLGASGTMTNTNTKGTSHGIIKTPSDSQGSTIDDFSAGI